MNAENRQAFVFPGQGTQRAGMAESVINHRNPDIAKLADRTFEEASDILQMNLRKLCLVGPDEGLDRPGITEPAILVTSIAALRALGYYKLIPDIVAGHSLGEYSALVAAESLSFEHAVSLVKSRGEFMQKAKDQIPEGMGMAAVLGLTLSEVEEICAQSGAEVANINTDTQIVISGRSNSVTYVVEKLGERKVKLIRVNIASHSSLMEPAKKEMKMLLEDVPISDPKIPFIQNVTANYAGTAEEVRRGLVDQITGRVLWLDTIRLMSGDGVRDFIEVGPGEVLSKLIRRIDPSASARHFEEFI